MFEQRRVGRCDLLKTTRLKRTARWVALLTALPGCVTTTVETSPKTTYDFDRRERRDPAEPVVTSEWREDENGAIRGKVTWASCSIERSFTTADERTTVTTPENGAGTLLVMGGSILALVGSTLLLTRSTTKTCTGGVGAAYSRCEGDVDDSKLPLLLILGGVGVATAGWVTRSLRTETKVEVLNEKTHRSRQDGPCIIPEDLAELSLILLLPTRERLRVGVRGDGSAQVLVPKGTTLPRDVDLPIAVYRVPRGAEGILKRGTVVGRVRLASKIEAAASVAAPPPP